MGNVNAPIKFTEFVSFTCSHCADFHINKLPSIKEKYIDKGLLRLELRDFPLDGLALRAAAMSRLVDQNKYYKFVEMLFNKQKNFVKKTNFCSEETISYVFYRLRFIALRREAWSVWKSRFE